MPTLRKCSATGASSSVSIECVWPISSRLRTTLSVDGTEGPFDIGRLAVCRMRTPSFTASTYARPEVPIRLFEWNSTCFPPAAAMICGSSTRIRSRSSTPAVS